MRLLSGIIGIFVILFIAYLMSSNRKAINVRTVFGAFFIQALFALFVLYIPFGQKVILVLSNGIQNTINAGFEGVSFVFGPLADVTNIGFIFAVKVLAIIIFISSLISILYYLKIMPFIVNTIGYGIHKLLGTSRTESLSSTANIFLGATEAPLVIKPYLNIMTKSELFAVMVGGLASVAGGTLVGYASLGVEIKYLVAASFMSAPAGLLMAKIIMPQTETPRDDINKITQEDSVEDKPVNIIEAAANGASSGLLLVVNIAATLIAFIGLVALMDMILGSVGNTFGFEGLSFNLILGYIFSPFAFLLGIPWDEAVRVGAFLGQKLIFNEFVAYLSFAKDMNTFSPLTQAIITFALCGFANISSMGMIIGGLGALSPKQKSNVASLAFKAVIAGTLANFMSAILAGICLSFVFI